MVVQASQPRSRRAVIAAGLGALGASVAGALGRPTPVRAGVDGDVVLGAFNTTTTETSITNSAGPNGNALHCSAAGTGTGVNGFSPSGVGVYGTSYGLSGVFGYTPGFSPDLRGVTGVAYGDGTGVMGTSSNAPGSAAAPGKTGVFGYAAQDAAAVGVYGKSTSGRGVTGQANGGIGVRALATTGVGVYTSATTGVALRAVGRVVLDNCAGLATIASGTSSVTVTPGIDISADTVVTLTPYADPGARRVWATTSAAANTLTIHVSSAVAVNFKVAWLAFG